MTDQILRVGYVPGVEPDRFARRWRDGRRPARLELVQIPWSRQRAALAEEEVDLCFVRLPLEDDGDLHVVPLWEERPVAVVGVDDVLSLYEDLGAQELAESIAIAPQNLDDAAERVAVAATGVGHALMPMSLARLHHRRDAVHRVVRDAEPTRVALAWPAAADDALRQEFVAVVRGRTTRSSRGEETPSRGRGGQQAGAGTTRSARGSAAQRSARSGSSGRRSARTGRGGRRG
ncbi:LysR substrate-binding domain-containing protein [Brachybacterium hainanense]|uniref:LysR substrate-binding domain-containing protein n=1 Tax=Brachybacterium hainanense TaxID=1541174 RepID=A0ABV6RFW7_9MICO